MAQEDTQQAGKKDKMSAAAKKYLVEGETVHWQGKPATIVIIGRGLVLTILSAIFIVAQLISPQTWYTYAAAVVACLLMIPVDRRFGLIGGIAGIVILAALALGLNQDLKWLPASFQRSSSWRR